jgi:anion-transporting  ArsA/GET3 family ATPase
LAEQDKEREPSRSGTAPAIAEKRLTLFLGKGGVGKTTLAAAWALALSRRGKKVLLAQVNAKERLSQLLGVGKVTSEIEKVKDNLWAVNMTPEASMHEYGLMVLRFESVYKLVFENKMSKAFLRAVPGLDDWTILGKTWFHEQEKLKDQSNRFDHIVLDCPATGHGVIFLGAPKAVTKVSPDGPLTEYAMKMKAMIEDAAKTTPVYVTLPEDMPYNETIELRQKIEDEVGLPKGRIVINGLHPHVIDAETGAAYHELLHSPEASQGALAPFVQAAQRRISRRHLQDGYVQKIEHSFHDLPNIKIPFFAARSFGLREVEQIADLLERSWIDRVPMRSSR